jgi:hypothetical protein
MAILPRYQRVGARSAQPQQVDFANFREGARLGQTISQQVDRMSDFVFKEQQLQAQQRGREIVGEMGAQPVLERLSQAGGPTTIGEREAYSVANRVAAAEIETDARQEINRIVTEGQSAGRSLSQIQAQLADVTDGFPASLANLDPETAGLLRNQLTNVANQAQIRYSSWASSRANREMQGRALVGISERQAEVFRRAASTQDPAERAAAIDQGIADIAGYMRGLQFGEAQISRMILTTREQAATDGTIAAFQRLGSLEEQQAFLTNLMEEPPLELGMEKTRTLVRSLNAEVNNRISVYNGAVRDISSDIKDLTTILTEGGDPNPETVLAIEGRIAELPPAMQGQARMELAQFQTVQSYTEAFRKMSPAMLQASINDLRSGVDGIGGEGVDTITETRVMQSAEGLLTTMNTEIERDPISWASRVGHIQFNAIDLTNDETASATIAQRIDSARTAQAILGSPLRFLTNEEALALTSQMQQGDRISRMQILGGITRHFGTHSTDVLAELSNVNPELAHVGGLVNMGAMQTANTALAGFDLIRDGNKAPGTTTAVARGAYINVVGQGLQFQGQARGTGFKVAEAIYTKMAFDAGLAEFDEGMWTEAVNVAFGYDQRTGTGGFDEIRDRQVLLPPRLNADQIETMLETITLEGLQRNTGLDTIDPEVVAQINENDRIFPVLVDEGRYYLMTEVNGIPRHFTDTDGNPLIVDAMRFYGMRGIEDMPQPQIQAAPEVMTTPAVNVEVGQTGMEQITPFDDPATGRANTHIMSPPGSSYMDLFRNDGLGAVKRVATETARDRFEASGIPARQQRELAAQLERLIETIPFADADQAMVDAYLEYITTPGASLSYDDFLRSGMGE